MLWIGNKVTTVNLIKYLLIPSLVCVVIPVLIASFLKPFQGEISAYNDKDEVSAHPKASIMLYLGLSSIVFVPVFKTITNLPPYVGMMLSLSIVAAFAEIFSNAKINISSIDYESDSYSSHSPVHSSLSKIELPSIQ